MTTTADPHAPDEFDLMYEAVRASFARATGPLFTTDVAEDLFDLYLDTLPADQRQVATCMACRSFLRRYGHLVTVGDNGTLTPVMWNVGDGGRMTSRAALLATVRRAHITGAFLTPDTVWGTPTSGGWTHLAVEPGPAHIHRGDRASANARAALIQQNRATLSRALREFNRDIVAQAVTLLEADALYRAEKVAGPARFLLALHDELAGKRGKVRENLLWRAAASAPPGYATPRSAMIGTLLEDLASGRSLAEVARRFGDKMHPLAYQRPQAAPSAGNIAAAEKLVAKLGIEPSLRRRYARLDEIDVLWVPTPPPRVLSADDGVFAHLKPQTRPAAAEVEMGPVTWAKFADKILPTAQRIEVYLSGRTGFYGMTTAEDPDAPPILQWDRENHRNPFSVYFYSGGSAPADWGLDRGWTDVDAVTLRPEQWRGNERAGSKNALFVLSGARDRRNQSLALFPENMRTELHPVRSTIEAFSRAGLLSGASEATANGIAPGVSDRIRVTTDTGRIVCHIDRWE